ncbi:SRPBCC family protein, partial [Brevibacterium sp. UMB10442]|nr:SRPBCC family protein [Brevibacterium sp. UMB10442]
SWRSDIEKVEVLSDTQFIEITKDRCRTIFTITRQDSYCIWEFDVENDNMKGHWVGIFGGNEKRATIDFTERIEPKKWFMIPFVKIYLKYRQAKYVRDLRNV